MLSTEALLGHCADALRVIKPCTYHAKHKSEIRLMGVDQQCCTCRAAHAQLTMRGDLPGQLRMWAPSTLCRGSVSNGAP